MNDKERYISEWLIFADEDYFTAGNLLKDENLYTRSICFHCQQATEKYLKAYIVQLNLPIIKTHNLGILVSHINSIDNGIEEIAAIAVSLTDYAVSVRYPDDFEKISAEEAIAAFKQTTVIKNFIALKLNI